MSYLKSEYLNKIEKQLDVFLGCSKKSRYNYNNYLIEAVDL